MNKQYRTGTLGFTIVELLIVIVVIGILAGITIVAYSGISQRAGVAVLQSDLSNIETQLEIARVSSPTETYPDNIDDYKYSDDINVEYDSDGADYCITVSSGAAGTSYMLDSTVGQITEGVCDGHVGLPPEGGIPAIPTAVTVGDYQACAIASEKAYCWGNNSSGQLGNNSTTNASQPVAVDDSGVLAGKTVTEIAAGLYHVCAVADNQAYCWGDNGSGKLGNNNGQTDSSVPVAVYSDGVLSGKSVTQIDAGWNNGCAIADDQAYCWGGGTWGMLGNNGTSSSYFPAAVYTAGVLAGKTVTDITVGNRHSCVIADGQAFCWGENVYGQLGNNSTTNSSVPVAVDTSGVLAGRTITDISATSSSTCVVADGEAFCWGRNSFRQLGNNSTTDSSIPVAVITSGVLSGKTVTRVVAGASASCAIADTQAFCWGLNSNGALGNSSANVPVQVSTSGVLSGLTVIDIGAGNGYSCVVAEQQVHCWGAGSYGQLGNGGTTSSQEPVTTLPFPSI